MVFFFFCSNTLLGKLSMCCVTWAVCPFHPNKTSRLPPSRLKAMVPCIGTRIFSKWHA
jgi:hypothetical protein